MIATSITKGRMVQHAGALKAGFAGAPWLMPGSSLRCFLLPGRMNYRTLSLFQRAHPLIRLSLHLSWALLAIWAFCLYRNKTVKQQEVPPSRPVWSSFNALRLLETAVSGCQDIQEEVFCLERYIGHHFGVVLFVTKRPFLFDVFLPIRQRKLILYGKQRPPNLFLALPSNNHYKHPTIQIQPMQAQSGFNFTESPGNNPGDADFKRQRQAYLAERNARKREEEAQMRKKRGSSSSSDQGLPRQPPPLPISKALKEGSNTQSSNSPQGDADFKLQRLRYKEERLMRREQALLSRRVNFGQSSSEEKDEVVIRPRAMKPPQLKVERAPFRQENEEGTLVSPFGFASLQVPPAINSARLPRDGRGLLSSVRLKDKRSQRRQARERYQVEVPSKKGVNVWLERWLQFKEASMQLAERSIPLYQISKVKLMASPLTPSGGIRIKLTLSSQQQLFLSANPKRINQTHYLDMAYFIFAKIISLKLTLMGRKPSPISRVREGLSANLLREATLAGKVRKSSFFGGWEQKLGVVGSAGLGLYKAGREEAGVWVAAGSVGELWTRFQFQRENLIVKLMSGKSKVEMSIPHEEFLCRENWLYQLYSLFPK